MSARFVGAIDQGTTSSRFIVFDSAGRIVTSAQKEHAQIYPKPGWVEHDPVEIWRNAQEVIGGALAREGLHSADLAAVGITNQRETTVLWDRRTGRPLHNALVWQDTRMADLVAAFARDGGKDRFRAATGLPLATYFSALKLRWLLENVPGARAKAAAGDALFGTIDSWLLARGPDVLLARRSEEHLRHGLLHADEHRHAARAVDRGAPDDGRVCVVA